MSLATLSAAPQVRPAAPARYLYNPIVDFLLLGGGSLIVLPLLALAYPAGTSTVALAGFSLMLAHVINHPHFAHSYQLFYKDYFGKLTSPSLSRALRVRYLIAGTIVPLLLVAYFCIVIVSANLVSLGLAANLMALLVGWHYVKQGYGMLIVDCVLKRRFFSARQKWILLANAYAVWAYAWMCTNTEIATKDFWNLKYYTFDLPDWLMNAAVAVVVVSSAGVVATLAHDLYSRPGPRPWSGIVAYFVTLYLWTAFATVNPAMLLLIPAFHSLQYLAVVWRFKSNAVGSDPSAAYVPAGSLFGIRPPKIGTVRLAAFAVLGVALGFAGFWGVPLLLDSEVAYDHALFGPTLFVFVFWLFINVHHYFLDSVMWRGENPDVRRHLFTSA